nr:MAG TPA: hypothetical protein [Caudoviricetes sp.]
MQLITNLILFLCTITMLWASNEYSKLVKKYNELANELYALKLRNKMSGKLTHNDVKKIQLLAQEQKENTAIRMAIEAIKATGAMTNNRSSDTQAKLILCLDVINKIPEKERTSQINNIVFSLVESIMHLNTISK